MKLSRVLKQAFVLVLTALVLAACGGGTPGPGGGGGNNPPGDSLQDLNGTYNGTFIVDDQTNDIFIGGLTTFTVTNGNLSGTLTSGNQFDFKGDVGELSGTVAATSNFATYDFDVTIDFATAPDYTAAGTATFSSGDEGLAGNVTLRRDGTFVGEFLIIGNKE